MLGGKLGLEKGKEIKEKPLPLGGGDRGCVTGFSDLVDLWVIKIKKPMILCARSMSRSREQSTKRRSRSENMRKVYSQNNNGMVVKNGRYIFGEIHEVRKGLWAVFLIVLFGC